MNKKAFTITWAELLGILLLAIPAFVIIFDVVPGFAKTVAGGKDDVAKEQLEEMVKYLNADINNIKTDGKERTFPMDIDGNKYAIAVVNCGIDKEGKCVKDKPKTQLCLRRLDIQTKDDCLKSSLDFAFSSDFYPVMSKNLILKWENNKLSLYSS